MRAFIEQLERSTDKKTIDFEKAITYEKSEHKKTKQALNTIIEDLNNKITTEADNIIELKKMIRSKEQATEKFTQNSRIL